MSSPLAAPLDIDELLTAQAFPHRVTELNLRETHLSWIVLTGDFAYKIKKPVRLEFIDATALSTRHDLCDQEVRLNRRLAEDIYLGTVPISRDARGAHVDGSGDAIEYAVKMRQFGETHELHALLERGAVLPQQMANLAERLARFHRDAPAPGSPGVHDLSCTANLRHAVLGNLATLMSHLDSIADVADLGRLVDWTHDALRSLMPALEARERDGYVRECHGDLHARNVVEWKSQLVPFDCLEFDPKLRWIDVMNDVAFLVMDLHTHGRNDLGCVFLTRYLEVSGDYAGLRLLKFYAVYRALVRAMVDSMMAQRARLCARVATAMDFLKPRAPRLVLIHGVSGSGKSWVSEHLIESLPAVRIRSDVERRRIATGPDRYGPGVSARVYAHMLDCAAYALEAGLDVIVDAAFLEADQRLRFGEFAEMRRTPWLIVSCRAREDELKRRIEARRVLGTDASEADAMVLGRQLETAMPLTAPELVHSVLIDTERPDAAGSAVALLRGHFATARPSAAPASRP